VVCFCLALENDRLSKDNEAVKVRCRELESTNTTLQTALDEANKEIAILKGKLGSVDSSLDKKL
jgi:hypothetical protein